MFRLSLGESPPFDGAATPNNALQRTEAGVRLLLAFHVLLRQPLSLSLSPLGHQNARMDIEYFPEPKALLIHGHEPKVVVCLRERVAELAAERIGGFAVHELPGFRSVGGCQLFVQHDAVDHGVAPDHDPLVFRCRLRPLTWRSIEGLLEPFSDGGYFAASHQYLDRHGRVYLIISGGRGW